MTRSLVVIVLSLILSAPALAAAKPKKCFTPAEQTAEREVRHGIFLREAARRCQGRFLPNAVRDWDAFEQANGSRFQAAVGRRIKAWKREFPDDWLTKQTHADGSIVTYARHVSVTVGFCDNVGEMLAELGKRGYGAFTRQAKTIRNEVARDYKSCQ